METAILALVRALHIGSAMMLVALPYFVLINLKPVNAAAVIYTPFMSIMTRWLWIIWVVQAISGLAWFWLVTAGMSDQSPWQLLDSSDLSAVLWQTQFGHLWLARSTLETVLGIILVLVSWRNQEVPFLSSLCGWMFLGIGTVLLATLAWAGHAAAGIHHHDFHLCIDIIHLLIGSIWPVGLIPLGLFLWKGCLRSRVTIEDGETKVLLGFSRASFAAVIAITTTGIINGWLMIGSWRALVATPYGELLLGKVVVVVVMVGLGACNRFYLLPRLQEGVSIMQFLRRTILAESVLAVIILLIVGMMGMTAPPPQ